MHRKQAGLLFFALFVAVFIYGHNNESRQTTAWYLAGFLLFIGMAFIRPKK
jgi:uncharacterized membrane protein YobD (UPF0266 family)